jgi:hypothetical protein
MMRVLWILLWAAAVFGELPEPYREIEVLPFLEHGWYSNRYSIEKLFKERAPVNVVIEVGSWMGTSTRHMAALIKKTRHQGTVFAVDHWLGSEEHQRGKPFWHPALPRLYQQFLSNVIHEGLADYITPMRMSSLEAAKILGEADIIYIDAAHDYENVYADLKAWYPHVKGHGVLCGDDWTHIPIERAVKQFAEEEGLEIVTEGRFWRYIEK